MGRLWKLIRSIVAIVFTLCIVFACGYYIGKVRNQRAEPTATSIVRPNVTFDLKLPGEVEKRIVTKEEIQSKLVEIGELATYQGEYTISKAADYSRYFIDDILIPGTTKKISLECEGIVKVGYDVETIVPTIDNDSQKIYIALPEPKVLDNYIIWDTVKCDDTNNILNPLDFSQYQEMIAEIEEAGLQKVKDEGIYEKAQKSVQKIIVNFLSGFQDFEVVFL